jgi:hypothetical protein
VPGPQFPLYLLGHQLQDWYPYVPIGGEMAVNCAILSYNGRVFFGFSGDVHAAPDLRKMEALLKESFTQLREAAGMPPTHSRKKVRKKSQIRSVAAAPAPADLPVPAEARASNVPAFRPPEPLTPVGEETVLASPNAA